MDMTVGVPPLPPSCARRRAISPSTLEIPGIFAIADIRLIYVSCDDDSPQSRAAVHHQIYFPCFDVGFLIFATKQNVSRAVSVEPNRLLPTATPARRQKWGNLHHDRSSKRLEGRSPHHKAMERTHANAEQETPCGAEAAAIRIIITLPHQ